MTTEMQVLYRCESEMDPITAPRGLDEVLRTLIDNRGIESIQLKAIVHSLEIWGAYFGEHDFGRFVIVTMPKMKETTDVVKP